MRKGARHEEIDMDIHKVERERESETRTLKVWREDMLPFQ